MDANMMGPAMSRFNKISKNVGKNRYFTKKNLVSKVAGVYVSETMFKYIWRISKMIREMEKEEQICKERLVL